MKTALPIIRGSDLVRLKVVDVLVVVVVVLAVVVVVVVLVVVVVVVVLDIWLCFFYDGSYIFLGGVIHTYTHYA